MERDWNEDNPGPGAYHANYDPTLRSAPKPTFGLRTNIWFDYDRPGPGTYDVRRDGNASPKYTMGDRFLGPSGTNVPGPGTYHANFKHTNHKAPAYTMQGPNHYNPDQGIPGPGTYDLREELGGPAYSLGQRFNAKLNTNPGPGTYSPKSPLSAPAYSMGQHLFDSLPSGPGPGTYNLRSAEFSGPMFSMAKRFYRLRDKKRERRYSNALRQRPHPQGPHTRPATNSRGVVPASHAPADCRFFDFKPKRATVLFPQDFDVEEIRAPPREIHRKHTTHIHYKPDIPSHIYPKPGPRKSQLPPCLDPNSAACGGKDMNNSNSSNNNNNNNTVMNQPTEEQPVEKKAKKERSGESWKDIAINLHKVRQTIVNNNVAATPVPEGSPPA